MTVVPREPRTTPAVEASASHRVRVGVLTNPVAEHNHRFPFTHWRMLEHLGSEADAVVTADKTEIASAVRHLLLERGVTVLALNGGDGTIHGAVNTAASILPPGARMPPLLLLNGGTYNMASRAMGTKGDPVGTLRRFQARWRDRAVSDLAVRTVPLLEVRRPGRQPMVGMFFGSETVANALALCDEMGAGYLGLARLLAKGAASYVLGTSFFREHSWRLRPTCGHVCVDGTAWGEVSAVVAATVDMKLARGMVWALSTSGTQSGFHAKLIRGKGPGDMIHLLPHMLWEVPHHMILSFPEAARVETSGRFTLDGELYDHKGPLVVGLSRLRVDLVAGEAL